MGRRGWRRGRTPRASASGRRTGGQHDTIGCDASGPPGGRARARLRGGGPRPAGGGGGQGLVLARRPEKPGNPVHPVATATGRGGSAASLVLARDIGPTLPPLLLLRLLPPLRVRVRARKIQSTNDGKGGRPRPRPARVGDGAGGGEKRGGGRSSSGGERGSYNRAAAGQRRRRRRRRRRRSSSSRGGAAQARPTSAHPL